MKIQEKAQDCTGTALAQDFGSFIELLPFLGLHILRLFSSSAKLCTGDWGFLAVWIFFFLMLFELDTASWGWRWPCKVPAP